MRKPDVSGFPYLTIKTEVVDDEYEATSSITHSKTPELNVYIDNANVLSPPYQDPQERITQENGDVVSDPGTCFKNADIFENSSIPSHGFQNVSLPVTGKNVVGDFNPNAQDRCAESSDAKDRLGEASTEKAEKLDSDVPSNPTFSCIPPGCDDETTYCIRNHLDTTIKKEIYDEEYEKAITSFNTFRNNKQATMSCLENKTFVSVKTEDTRSELGHEDFPLSVDYHSVWRAQVIETHDEYPKTRKTYGTDSCFFMPAYRNDSVKPEAVDCKVFQVNLEESVAQTHKFDSINTTVEDGEIDADCTPCKLGSKRSTRLSVSHAGIASVEATQCKPKQAKRRASALRKKERKSQTTKPIPEKLYFCTVCSTGFKRHKDLKEHARLHKKRKYRRYSELLENLKSKSSMTETDVFKCTHCNKSFKFAVDLTRHLKTHEEQQLYEKALMKYRGIQNFTKSSNRWTVKSNTPLSKKIIQLQGIKDQCSDKAHSCAVCGSAFPSASALRVHLYQPERPVLAEVPKPKTTETSNPTQVTVKKKQYQFACSQTSGTYDETLQRNRDNKTRLTPEDGDYGEEQWDTKSPSKEHGVQNANLPSKVFYFLADDSDKGQPEHENLASGIKRIKVILKNIPNKRPEQETGTKSKKRITKRNKRISKNKHEATKYKRAVNCKNKMNRNQSSACCSFPSVEEKQGDIEHFKSDHSMTTRESSERCRQCKQWLLAESAFTSDQDPVGGPHPTEAPFLCQNCGENFTTAEEYDEHCAVKHRQNRPVKSTAISPCLNCHDVTTKLPEQPKTLTYSTGSNRKRCVDPGPDACCGCHVCLRPRHSLKVFKRNYKPESTRGVEAGEIVTETLNTGRFNMFRRHSNPRRLFTCRYCENAFDTTQGLSAHQRVHIKVMPYECNQCTERFQTSEDLQAHRGTHSGNNIFLCVFCNALFPTVKGLNIHLSKYERENMDAHSLKDKDGKPISLLARVKEGPHFLSPVNCSSRNLSSKFSSSEAAFVKLKPKLGSRGPGNGEGSSTEETKTNARCESETSDSLSSHSSSGSLEYQNPDLRIFAPVPRDITQTVGSFERSSTMHSANAETSSDKKNSFGKGSEQECAVSIQHRKKGTSKDQHTTRVEGFSVYHPSKSNSLSHCAKTWKPGRCPPEDQQTPYCEHLFASEGSNFESGSDDVDDNVDLCKETLSNVRVGSKSAVAECQDDYITQTPSSDTAYLCVECESAFPDKVSLDEHLNSENKHMTCCICSKIFSCRKALKKHVNEHIRDSGTDNLQRSTTSVLSTNSTKHLKTLTCAITTSTAKTYTSSQDTSSPHMCHLCGKSFPHGRGLWKHRRSHISERENKGMQTKSKIRQFKKNQKGKSSDQLYKCPFCDASFPELGLIFSHTKRHTEGSSVNRGCRADFSDRRDLTDHSCQQEKTYCCLRCLKPYSDSCSPRVRLLTHYLTNCEGN